MRQNSTSIDTLESIAEVLNVPISIFFEDNEKVSISATADNGSAASVIGGASVLSSDCSVEALKNRIEFLNREIKHYKAMLEEKERTINILMSK